MKPQIFEDEEVDVMDDTKETNHLVVHNDDYNSFDHVINTLIEVCKHTLQQAEQCTTLIHYKGKCKVKEGSFEDLVPLKRAINDRGIEATID